MSGTAADVWKTLKETYATVSDLGAASAENALCATRLVDGNDFLEHVGDLRLKWKNAVERGAVINDSQFRAIIISSLPESWNFIVAAVQYTKTSAELIAGLTVHWDRLREQSAIAKSTATALLTKSSKPRSSLICVNQNCKRTGHTIENCYWPGGGKEGHTSPYHL
ncbi:hypothetical protein H0H92_004996 [Tricholoma furcatifolium]|nr:hypothetical protein H0H92_004996 [Tricholoma furcatifolium]